MTIAPAQICFGTGYSFEAISLKIQLVYNFMNCYKKMTDNIADWDATFTGKDAKWIDACTTPSSSPTIKMKEITFTDSITESSTLGDTNMNKKGCFKYGGWTAWAPYLVGVG